MLNLIGPNKTFTIVWTWNLLMFRKFLSEVGFEPTPSIEDQNSQIQVY